MSSTFEISYSTDVSGPTSSAHLNRRKASRNAIMSRQRAWSSSLMVGIRARERAARHGADGARVCIASATGYRCANASRACCRRSHDLQSDLAALRGTVLVPQLKALGVNEHSSDLKVHVGCGGQELPGWINVDNYPAPLAINLNWGLPLPDRSARYVFLVSSPRAPLLSGSVGAVARRDPPRAHPGRHRPHRGARHRAVHQSLRRQGRGVLRRPAAGTGRGCLRT